MRAISVHQSVYLSSIYTIYHVKNVRSGISSLFMCSLLKYSGRQMTSLLSLVSLSWKMPWILTCALARLSCMYMCNDLILLNWSVSQNVWCLFSGLNVSDWSCIFLSVVSVYDRVTTNFAPPLRFVVLQCYDYYSLDLFTFLLLTKSKSHGTLNLH